MAWAVVRELFLFYSIYSSLFLLLRYFCIDLFDGVRNIQMVSVAMCQIRILDVYITKSPSYIQIGTRSSEYAGVQLSLTRIHIFNRVVTQNDTCFIQCQTSQRKQADTRLC